MFFFFSSTPRISVSQRVKTLRRVMPWVALWPLLTIALGGCVVGPVYRMPSIDVPEAWSAPLPSAASASTSTRHVATIEPIASMADWWTSFDDPAVATLVRWAEADSPTLDKAVAAIDSARAALSTSRSAGLPTLSGAGSVTRARQASIGIPSFTSTERAASLDASWEIDLFGRLKHGREAAEARIEARAEDWRSARVSLAAEVVDDYVQYRACRFIEASDAEQLASLRETARITAIGIAAGLNPPADDDLAQAGAASASATLIDQQTSCELLVKALVALTAVPEVTLRALVDRPRDALPVPREFEVYRLPATLLRQRPDIVAAERTLAAASADIGAAEADRYPSLSLGGSIGVSAASGVSPLRSWSFGPSLSLPIADGGARRAAVASAQATDEAAYADYRSSVRSAVQDVEEALARVDGAARRSADSALAAERYRRYFRATETNWRAGGTTLLSLEEARRSSITAQVSKLTLDRDRLRYYIALYKALGGGWDANSRLADAAASNVSEGPP